MYILYSIVRNIVSMIAYNIYFHGYLGHVTSPLQDLAAAMEAEDHDTLGDIVEEEMAATASSIEAAAQRIQARGRGKLGGYGQAELVM